jgi:hypothetical protein
MQNHSRCCCACNRHLSFPSTKPTSMHQHGHAACCATCMLHLQALGDDDAGGCEHGPPRVDELVRTELLHLRRVLAQAQRVIAVAAGTGCSASATTCACWLAVWSDSPASRCSRLPCEQDGSQFIVHSLASVLATLKQTMQHSLAGQRAVQVGGDVLGVQQAAGQVQRTAGACSGAATISNLPRPYRDVLLPHLYHILEMTDIWCVCCTC